MALKRWGTLGVLLLVTLLLVACDDQGTSADTKQAAATAASAAQANQQVGMPGITQFTERRIVRKLYELRDKNALTFSYIPDMNGKLWHLCDSLGYGLPYGVQFTNPEHIVYEDSSARIAMPQPEPNGLFMPPGADGTWVICTGAAGDFQPIYVEPRVVVSPFKLAASGEYQLSTSATVGGKAISIDGAIAR